MEANKVILNGTTLIDLTEDTVVVSDVLQGKTFHSADGEQRVGTFVPDVGEKVVFIYDPYGEVIASYSKNAFLALTQYPEAPALQGLTFQEYNWSLSDAKNYVTNYGELNIGATYKTTSGLTEFDIELTPITGLTITFKMAGNTNWGDGTSETTTSSSTHTYASYGKYTITCDGTAIPQNIFGLSISYYCTNVRIGENITSFSYQSFYFVFNLVTLTIPNSITSINTNTFDRCRSLTSITIPSSVTSIGRNVFSSCTSLTSVSIGSGVTAIGNSAFQSCSGLTSITIPNSVTSIGESVFSSCYSLTSIIIPNNVISIGAYAFQNCYSLTSVTIGSSVTAIGNSAFKSCSGLTSITIPNSVTSIEFSTFYNCTGVKSVTIGSGLTTIQSGTFTGCIVNLLYDFSQAVSVPTLSYTDAFNEISPLCKIVVPDALYETWITETNWSSYANYIYKASEVN